MKNTLFKHLPDSVISVVRTVAAGYLPEGSFKDRLRQTYRVSKRTAKVEDLDIVDSGIETIKYEEYPYVKLANCHLFYGYTSDKLKTIAYK